MNKLLIAFICFVIIAIGCRKPSDFSTIPEIEFKKIVLRKDVMDDLGNTIDSVTITFSFTDGDGDIGNAGTDTSLFAETFGIKNNSGKSIDNYNFKIPVLTSSGSNKALRGDIDVHLMREQPPGYDTLFFKVYIIDRALNKSNVITTPSILMK